MLVGRIRPAVLLQAALLLSVTSNLGRIPVLSVGVSSAALLINDLAVLGAILGGVLVAVRARVLSFDAVAGWALLFALIGAVSAIAAVPRFGLSAFDLALSLSYLARWLFYFSIYLLVINFVRREQVPAVWGALEWMLLVFAGFGIVQSIFLPGFAQMVYPDAQYDWDPQGHRLVSTVLEPNIAAAMLMLGLLVHLGQMAVGARVQAWKPLLLFVAMVMTLSRSGALGLFFGGIVILSVRGLSKRLLRLGAGIALATVIALPVLLPFAQQYDKLRFASGSAVGRLVNLTVAGNAFLENPWIGIGFNTFGFYAQRTVGLEGVGADGLAVGYRSSDGGLLFAAVMTGIIGLTLYIFMLASVIRRCRGIWRSAAFTPEERGLCIGTAAGIIGLCIHSVFVNSLFSTAVLLPLWVLWGLTYSIGADAHAATPDEPGALRAVALVRS